MSRGLSEQEAAVAEGQQTGTRGAGAAPGAVPSVLDRLRWPNALWVLGFAAAGLVLFAAYLMQARAVPVQSDGASNALQAWDMLHGNLLLRGWTLTDLSFYTTELPEYMLIEAVHGLAPGSEHIASALTYTLVVLGAALLAKGRADGREGVVRCLIAGGIMLAPTIGGTANTLLSLPDHTGTQVPLLIVWLILDRARPRWWVPVAVTLVLAWSQVADPLVTYEGVLPVLVVCAVGLYRRRGAIDGRPLRWLRESWFELSLAVGAVVSAGVATLTLRLISRAGGFTVSPPDTMFSHVGDLARHLSVTAESILVVFGADFSGTKLGSDAVIPLLHLAGVALAAWGLAVALRRFASEGLVIRLLTVAMVVMLAAYTFSGDPNVIGGAHEIVGLLPVGAVLAARLLAAPLIRGRHLAAAALLLGCYCGMLAYSAVQKPPEDTDAKLALVLHQHNLGYGLAAYWNAGATTEDSGGQVTVRPVNLTTDNQLMTINRDTIPSWYDPKLHNAQFLILPRDNMSCSAGPAATWLKDALAIWGQPDETYRVDGLKVLVWRHKNLLRSLVPATSGVC